MSSIWSKLVPFLLGLNQRQQTVKEHYFWKTERPNKIRGQGVGPDICTQNCAKNLDVLKDGH